MRRLESDGGGETGLENQGEARLFGMHVPVLLKFGVFGMYFIVFLACFALEVVLWRCLCAEDSGLTTCREKHDSFPLNHSPYTLNPKPKTQDPKPYTFNFADHERRKPQKHEPGTLNPRSDTVNPKSQILTPKTLQRAP